MRKRHSHSMKRPGFGWALMLLFAFAMPWVGATAELMARSVEVEKLWHTHSPAQAECLQLLALVVSLGKVLQRR